MAEPITRELWTDENGYVWYALRREDGSVSIYYTKPHLSTHWVMLDTLDKVPDPPWLPVRPGQHPQGGE